MNFTISFNNGILSTSYDEKTNRDKKGNSLISFPNEYVVIDIETTGLDSNFDKIIELSALKVKNDEIIDKYSTLINPKEEIDEFITQLTGINNEMVKNAPYLENELPRFRKFIGNSILVGHNVNFDINFIYDYSERLGIESFSNDFVDTMRLSRRLLQDMKHHRLRDLAEKYCIINENEHRALSDCETTLKIYNKLKEEAISQYNSLDGFINYCQQNSSGFKSKYIIANQEYNDPDNLLFGKNVAITGKLERMERKDAMQIIADIGGLCNDNVTQETNYLILGNNDYNSILKGAKSSKLIKAEKMKRDGKDIDILSENVFYDLISDYLKYQNN